MWLTSRLNFVSDPIQAKLVRELFSQGKWKFALPCLFLLFFACNSFSLVAQERTIKGSVRSSTGEVLEFASILAKDLGKGTQSDSLGQFTMGIPSAKKVQLIVSRLGYKSSQKWIDLTESTFSFVLDPMENSLEEVVVSGTLQELSRADSPVPVEVFKSTFFDPIRRPPYLNRFNR